MSYIAICIAVTKAISELLLNIPENSNNKKEIFINECEKSLKQTKIRTFVTVNAKKIGYRQQIQKLLFLRNLCDHKHAISTTENSDIKKIQISRKFSLINLSFVKTQSIYNAVLSFNAIFIYVFIGKQPMLDIKPNT